MMHVSGRKIQKTFIEYTKLFSEEIADDIANTSKKDSKG